MCQYPLCRLRALLVFMRKYEFTDNRIEKMIRVKYWRIHARGMTMNDQHTAPKHPPFRRPEQETITIIDLLDHVVDVASDALDNPVTQAGFISISKIIFFSRATIGLFLGGFFLFLIALLGSSLGIGFHAAWSIYGYQVIVVPVAAHLIFFGIVLVCIAFGVFGRLVQKITGSRYVRRWINGLVASGISATFIIALAYFTSRQENQMLSSQPANLELLTKSVGDQSQLLSNLSESGKALLSQLNATETELEKAKGQLSATLNNFDTQRQAAGRVTAELKRIDARQKQIALQTEELERILEGQQPITRKDLQRANWQGLISGLVIGFVTSLLASIAHNALRRRKPDIL
jgi:hypothetical protein